VTARGSRLWWVGQGINGGAMVYLYSMQAFALAIVVHYASSLSCTIAILEADCEFAARYVR
jgi:hypothetical protein